MRRENMKETELIIFESPNGRDQWKPLLPKDVPEWVKDPEIISRMIDGEICMDAKIGDKGSPWYCAEQAPSESYVIQNVEDAQKAEDKRKRKNNLRIVKK